jgi:hypothetical protein
MNLLADAEKAPLADLREKCLRAKAVDAERMHARLRRIAVHGCTRIPRVRGTFTRAGPSMTGLGFGLHGGR